MVVGVKDTRFLVDLNSIFGSSLASQETIRRPHKRGKTTAFPVLVLIRDNMGQFGWALYGAVGSESL